MSTRPRTKHSLHFPLLAVAISVCALPQTTLADPPSLSPEEQAEKLNESGKSHFGNQRYRDASRDFKQAATLNPLAKYYFNLCYSLESLEQYQQAIIACEVARTSPNADKKLVEKSEKLLLRLQLKIPPNNPNNPNPNNPNPNNPNPNNPNPNNPNNPNPNPNPNNPNPNPNNPNPNQYNPNNPNPNQYNPNNPNPNQYNPNNPNQYDPNNPNPNQYDPNNPNQYDPNNPYNQNQNQIEAAVPSNDYRWSLAASIAPVVNLGFGELSQNDRKLFADSGRRLTIAANFISSHYSRIGLQGYLGITSLDPQPRDSNLDPLRIIDLGGAVYKHFAISENIDVTPAAGLQITLLQPDSTSDDGLVAVGARLQTSLDWSLGSANSHVVSFAPALNIYGPGENSTTLKADVFGLDHPAVTIEFAIGYQYRFSSKFGSSPLLLLE